jgi:hypothetical protein
LILDFVAKGFGKHSYNTFDHFQAEDEDGEAEDDELDADAEDKENIESKAGSSLPNKRKRDNEDDANGDK